MFLIVDDAGFCPLAENWNSSSFADRFKLQYRMTEIVQLCRVAIERRIVNTEPSIVTRSQEEALAFLAEIT